MTEKTKAGAGKKEPVCKDSNCAVHGHLKLRGRSFTGTVTSAKMRRTISVHMQRRRYLPKYERYERRMTTIKAHNPDCIGAAEGDKVTIIECRPISKTKKFIVQEKV